MNGQANYRPSPSIILTSFANTIHTEIRPTHPQ